VLLSLICLEPCWGFLADAAVQSEARKIILPQYGIREFKAKNFELPTLIRVFLLPKEIVSWHNGVICMLLVEPLEMKVLKVSETVPKTKRSKREYGEFMNQGR